MNTPYGVVLREFGWLADLYALDFLVDDHWKRLPTSWQRHFDGCIRTCRTSVDAVKFAEAILREGTCHCSTIVGPFPLSLIVLKQCVSLLSINRTAVSSRKQIAELCYGSKRDIRNGEELTRLKDVLPHRLRQKIKSKKEHEIERMFDLLDVLLQQFSSRRENWQVLDVGSGIGHLSRMLSLLLKVDVATVEGNAEFVEMSLAMDKFYKRMVDGNIGTVDGREWKAPSRQLAYIDANANLSIDRPLSVLVGLHACGDLSPTILSNFLNDSNVKVLVSVGCCYHKLNSGLDKPFRDEYENLADRNSSGNFGYPLSQHFHDLNLSYASRELACFSIEYFREKLRESMHSKVMFVNCYRAILEWLILDCPALDTDVDIKIDPKLRHRGLRGVKNAEKIDFWQYSKETLRADEQLREKVLKMKEDVNTVNAVEQCLKNESERILLVYTLRLVIAPLIETILTEDRRLYLKENTAKSGISLVSVVPLFDVAVSPRNLVLVAVKNPQ